MSFRSIKKKLNFWIYLGDKYLLTVQDTDPASIICGLYPTVALHVIQDRFTFTSGNKGNSEIYCS